MKMNIKNTAIMYPLTGKLITKMIQLGNAKLPKNIGIVNLPCKETCPWATDFCLGCCYAQKAENIRPACLPYRKRMLYATQQDNFVDFMTNEVKRVNLYKHRIDYFRIHESGDFYSTDYYAKWLGIINNVPELKFLAYTKNPNIGRIERPKNLILKLSWDISTDLQALNGAMKDYDGLAYTIPKGQTCPKGYFHCTETCHTCKYCYDGKGNVAFDQH